MDKKTINYFKSKQKTIEERFTEGKALRDKFPRKEQGDYKPDPKRADPISILEEQAKTRLTELVPIRYARMLTSPFAFLRGGAAIMAADLAAGSKPTGIFVQTCGDMHVANFGLFASAERTLIFGINDFDETLPGPWEWDIKRLVASIVASGRFLGAKKNLCTESVLLAVSSYKKSMRDYSAMGHIELVYATMTEKDLQKKLPPSVQKGLKKITDKARERTHFQVLDKLANIVHDKYRLRDDAPFIVHETHTQSGRPIDEALGLLLESYMLSLADDRIHLLKQYRIVDVARKVVGVGSVGTRCWIIFMLGNNSEDPLFLQVKEAQPSVFEPYVSKSAYSNHGHRVVAGQRLLQAAPDIFIGWGEQDGIHFYVRQLRDMKGGVEFDPDKVNIENFPEYCKLCGEVLALAHAKSGNAAMISGYLGKSDEFDQAMVQFAFAYADQTEQDYQALVAAAASGRIKVARAES
ncbi:DUF2252 domain-containing protein [Flavobacterium taihuense]|uniref:DUF2252 domain-containing protein n=1 Tax=Flavobacterium taihuense TaxID=2857508 RepID=A0ABS6XVT7_9FLAO|nr:DUF2252 domain-containing protein [Flavobacterium taihuense]MBW4360699.1 DUF2252 domain-containing protein [Flavobacterium taihuense]